MSPSLTTPVRQSLNDPMAQSLNWLSVADAAQRLGQTDRHTRRRAAEEFLPQGKARCQDNQWQIRSDADPLLAPILGTQISRSAVSPDLSRLTKRARDRASDRARILALWRDACAAGFALNLGKDPITDAFLQGLKDREGREIGRRTLYNWAAQAKDGDLTDGRQTRGGRTRDTAPTAEDGGGLPPFLAELKHLYLGRNQLKPAVCYLHASLKAQEHGWEIPFGKRQALRWLNQLDPREVILRREGPKAFNDQVAPNLIRSKDGLASNAFWFADHSFFDVLVQVGERLNTKTGEAEPVYKRPCLTCWKDARSGLITGHIVRAADPDTDAIILALAKGVARCGVAEAHYTDNGRDFDSKALTGITKTMRWTNRKLHIAHDQKRLGGIYGALGVKHVHSWAYHPQSKGQLEGWFGYMHEHFDKLWPTYCGKDTASKPEQLAQRLGDAPTLAEFTAAFDAWLDHEYHAGLGLDHCPRQVWDDHLGTKRTCSPELLEVLLQPRVGPLRVHNNGVTVQTLTYGRGAISHLFGQQVFVRVRPTVNAVSIWSLDDKFLALAECNQVLPFDTPKAVLTAAIKEKTRDIQAIKKSFTPRLRIHEGAVERIARATRLAQEQGTGIPPGDNPPPSYKPIRSDLEGQIDAHQRALERPLKKAVGAEYGGTFDLDTVMEDLDLAPARASSIPSLLQLVGDE